MSNARVTHFSGGKKCHPFKRPLVKICFSAKDEMVEPLIIRARIRPNYFVTLIWDREVYPKRTKYFVNKTKNERDSRLYLRDDETNAESKLHMFCEFFLTCRKAAEILGQLETTFEIGTEKMTFVNWWYNLNLFDSSISKWLTSDERTTFKEFIINTQVEWDFRTFPSSEFLDDSGLEFDAFSLHGECFPNEIRGVTVGKSEGCTLLALGPHMFDFSFYDQMTFSNEAKISKQQLERLVHYFYYCRCLVTDVQNRCLCLTSNKQLLAIDIEQLVSHVRSLRESSAVDQPLEPFVPLEKRDIVEPSDFDQVLGDYFQRMKLVKRDCVFIFGSEDDLLTKRLLKMTECCLFPGDFDVSRMALWRTSCIILAGDMSRRQLRTAFEICQIETGMFRLTHFFDLYRKHFERKDSLPKDFIPPSMWLLKQIDSWKIWLYGNTPHDQPCLHLELENKLPIPHSNLSVQLPDGTKETNHNSNENIAQTQKQVVSEPLENLDSVDPGVFETVLQEYLDRMRRQERNLTWVFGESESERTSLAQHFSIGSGEGIFCDFRKPDRRLIDLSKVNCVAFSLESASDDLLDSVYHLCFPGVTCHGDGSTYFFGEFHSDCYDFRSLACDLARPSVWFLRQNEGWNIRWFLDTSQQGPLLFSRFQTAIESMQQIVFSETQSTCRQEDALPSTSIDVAPLVAQENHETTITRKLEDMVHVDSKDFEVVIQEYFDRMSRQGKRETLVVGPSESGKSTLAQIIKKWNLDVRQSLKIPSILNLQENNCIALIGDVSDRSLHHVYESCWRFHHEHRTKYPLEKFIQDYRDHCERRDHCPPEFLYPSFWLLRQHNRWRVWWFGNTPVEQPFLWSNDIEKPLASGSTWYTLEEKRPPGPFAIASRIRVGNANYFHDREQDVPVFQVAMGVIEKLMVCKDYALRSRFRLSWSETESLNVIRFRFEPELADQFRWWYYRESDIEKSSKTGIATEVTPEQISNGTVALFSIFGYAHYPAPKDEK